MRPSPSVSRFPVEDGLLLLDNRSGRLFAYNHTACHLWNLIEAGRPADQLVCEFADAWGIPASLARSDIESILALWRGQGLLAAGEADAAPLAPTVAGDGRCDPVSPPATSAAEWTCTVGPVTIEFVIGSERLAVIRTMLAHLETPGASPRARIEVRIAPSDEAVLLVNGAERSRVFDLGMLVGGVWQTILELVHPDVEWLALIHGAAVSRGGTGIALCAPSGSGKSTLTAALTASSFTYLADDLVAISAPDGEIVPWPAPISIKPGSIAAITPHRPEVAAAPRYRTKGVEARLLVPPATALQAPQVPLRYLVFPRFVSGAAPELQPVSSFQALERLLADRVWIGHPITADRVEAFVAWLNTTPAYAATYGSLYDGMRLVEEVIEDVA